MLYGQPNELYELALKTHERHSKQHGYEMHVLRRGITGGYWNKLAFLLKLVIQELEKPESERTDWIMCVSQPSNPQRPNTADRALLIKNT